MKNNVLVKIEGKNVNNYIKWLIKNKINISNLKVINHNELNIIIDYKDYNLLTKYSKTYKVKIIKKFGKLKLIETIKNNSVILSCTIFAILFLYYLSNYIFSIDIIYNNKQMVEIISKELLKYDIKKYSKKKNKLALNQIKKQILKDNQDVLEWFEIEEIGTKYVVRLVERKKATKNEEYTYQSIATSKDAIITSINAYSGEKVKNINEYVKKDTIIISGILTKTDNTKIYTKASGNVYGEVWYKANVEYPLYYREERLTGKSKKVITLSFLNKKIPLFPYKKYKQFKSKSYTLTENNIIPIKILKEQLYEVNIKEDIYTNEEAIQKAIDETKKKMRIKNNKIIEIKNVEIINKENLNSKIKIDLFISVIEDISKIVEVKEEADDNYLHS